MFRKLAVSLAVAGVLSATQANALGLGQIRIKSALNEPLDAEIQLLRVRDLDAQQIQPQMADMDQFAIAGLDRSRLLSSVQFSVDVKSNGTGVIHLTSSQPVREPFLNLLVEVNWPSGRLVREYTVLLDPPVFEAAPIAGAAAPVQAPVTVAPARPASAPVALAPAPRRPSGPVDNIRTRAGANQVFVETQDTLGQLARRYSPGGGTTLNQMMLALQRKNPHAFPSNNINFLKAGVVLDLPTLEEVRAVSAADATREVSRQVQAWKTGASSAATTSTPQTDGSKKKPVAPSEPPADAAPASQPQLKILTTEDSSGDEKVEESVGAQEAAPSVPATPESQALLQRNEALENQLAVTQETVDRVERENAELNEKLTAITQQLETLQRLLELKDEQMAALQNQLQQVQEAPAQPAAPIPPAPQKPAGIVETLTSSPAYMAGIGAAVGALLVGLIGLLRRRKDEARPYNVEDAETATVMPGAAGAVGAAAAVAAGAVAAEVLSGEESDGDRDETVARVAENADSLGPKAEVDDLDLDMDLDLDLPLDQASAAASVERGEQGETALGQQDDDEFDLTLDGDFEDELLPNDRVSNVAEEEDEFDLSFDSELDTEESSAVVETAADEDFDESLDDILGTAMGEEEEAQQADLRSGMGQLESFEDLEDDEPEETLESLGLDSVIAASEVPEEPVEGETELGAQDRAAELARSQEEEEDYRLSMVQPVLPDDDELLGTETEAASDVDAGKGEDTEEAKAEEAAAAPQAPAFEIDDAAGEEQIVGATESASEAPAFEFDDELESVAEEAASEDPESAVSDDEFDIDDILAASGAELTLEDDAPALEAKPDAGEEDAGLNLHPELEALLSADSDDDDEEAISIDEETSGDSDLDDMLAALEKDFREAGDTAAAEEDLSEVEEELTANIAHDLEDDESDLDSELEALLGSVDDEIALDESGAEDEDLGMDGLEFLDGTDEVETKLDLARAYIDMEDRDGAKDILSEIIEEGSNQQQQEARKLMESLT
ncbi:MAG: hypothetical protein HWE39_25280 [Oceanospirillaceae bacterium]|nr:hypothetical protein [Oceanospirillaceae bacterium]